MAETAAPKLIVTFPSDREIRMTREIAAPRALVFEAHTKAVHLRNWWGPRRMTMVSCEVDLRIGGRWRFVQRDEDGQEYAFRGEYREIVEPERLAYTFEFEGMPGHVNLETITFEERGGRTLLTSVSLYDTREERDAVIESGMESGAAESMDRLEELVGPTGRAAAP